MKEGSPSNAGEVSRGDAAAVAEGAKVAGEGSRGDTEAARGPRELGRDRKSVV